VVAFEIYRTKRFEFGDPPSRPARGGSQRAFG